MNIRSITLDLDGTLVDSVPDLTLACQAMLQDLHEVPITEHEIRSFVGEGMANLVRRCLARTGEVDALRLETGIAAFRQHYRRLNGHTACLYPGVLPALQTWHLQGLPLACVTNKPEEFTRPLLKQLGIAHFFKVVVGGDTCEHKKPHPEPILFACQQMGSDPRFNLHIGDSRHDVAAARAAGCVVGGVPYGYNGESPLAAASCDVFCTQLDQFSDFLDARLLD